MFSYLYRRTLLCGVRGRVCIHPHAGRLISSSRADFWTVHIERDMAGFFGVALAKSERIAHQRGVNYSSLLEREFQRTGSYKKLRRWLAEGKLNPHLACPNLRMAKVNWFFSQVGEKLPAIRSEKRSLASSMRAAWPFTPLIPDALLPSDGVSVDI